MCVYNVIYMATVKSSINNLILMFNFEQHDNQTEKNFFYAKN